MWGNVAITFYQSYNNQRDGGFLNFHFKNISCIHNIQGVHNDEGSFGRSVVKNSPANAGDSGSILGLGRFSAGGNGNPLQYSCLGNPMDRGAR